MYHSRTLTIDGEEVTFEIGFVGQAMAIPLNVEPARTAEHPFLGAEVTRAGKLVWSGMLSDEVQSGAPLSELFSDADLERLYRQKRAELGTQPPNFKADTT